MSLPSRPAGRQNPEANYQGFVKRFSPESSCSDNSRYRGQPDQALLLGDSSYLLESDQMAQREAMDVMAGEAHEESEWSDIRPRDVTENFSRLVTLATGGLTSSEGSGANHQAPPATNGAFLSSEPVPRCPASQRLTTEEISGDLLGQESGVNSKSPREVAMVAPAGCHRTLTIGMRPQVVDLDDLLNLREDRTTLMIKRVPRKYSLALLREEIASFPGLNDSYDLLYLPADASKDANRGYAFINLKSVSHVYLFTSMLQNHEWRHYNAPRRTCQLCFAHIQGREDTLQHLTQERHPLYMLQQRRRHLDAAPELNLLPVSPQEVWGVGDYQMPNEDILQLGSSTSMP